MLKMADILDENDKTLRKKSEEVTFPLSKEDQKAIDNMIEYLKNSQTPELSEKYKLRPGMGLSAVQIGILKRYYVVVHEYEEGKFDTYVLINPKIKSNSQELIYVEEGEGCLSVNRYVEGIVPRYARVTMEAYVRDGNKIAVRGREELAVVFQ
ncbi:MAG: peptide deformylase, partial [Bacilli bacterium]|nr:peptide deformylase [Bacilli bacterium]